MKAKLLVCEFFGFGFLLWFFFFFFFFGLLFDLGETVLQRDITGAVSCHGSHQCLLLVELGEADCVCVCVCVCVCLRRI